MKRLIRAAALLVLLALLLCACGAVKDNPAASENNEAVSSAVPDGEVTGGESPAPASAASPEDFAQPEPARASESERAEEPGGPVCSLRIDCGVLLSHLEELDPVKQALVPEDGLILDLSEVPLEAGDTVFTLMRRVLQQQNLHFEFSFTGGADTAYLQGLNNLYEFDCGPLSGWEYQVNGQFQGVGCGQYTLSDGDAVVWYYTCDLGADIGNDYPAQW